jgi:hypothetical protein
LHEIRLISLIGHHLLHPFRAQQCFSREYHPAPGTSSFLPDTGGAAG